MRTTTKPLAATHKKILKAIKHAKRSGTCIKKGSWGVLTVINGYPTDFSSVRKTCPMGAVIVEYLNDDLGLGLYSTAAKILHTSKENVDYFIVGFDDDNDVAPGLKGSARRWYLLGRSFRKYAE